MSTCPTCQAAYPPETVVCPSDGTPLGHDPALVNTQPSPPGNGKAKTGPDPLLGTMLAGRFNITRKIGEGGMGMVYEANHAVIGRQVALKVLHERHADRPEVAARLMNEAKLASSIHHEHIVDIFDFGETSDGRTFVVMELLDGESLTQLIRREGTLTEARTIDLALQVASALGAAHEKGIIHRDVKPENVFISQRNGKDFAKVVDFGISKAIKVGPDGQPITPRLTQTGMVLGTPLYMSPEQARGEEDLDHRIDVYALGVIVYECLTGEVPFRGGNYLGIISQVLTDTPVAPRKLAPDREISDGIDRVVMKALSKARADRYQSMAEFSADLERVMKGQTVEAPVTPVEKPAPPPRRRATGIIAFAGVALAGGIAALLLVGRSPSVPLPQNAGAAIVPAPLQSPAPPAAPSPPPTVILKVSSNPSGATILDGSRKLGIAPQSIELEKDRPVHLTFRLDGYEDGATDVSPKYDGEPLDIELRAVKKVPRVHPRPKPVPAVGATPAGPDALPTSKNPYPTKK